MAEKKKKLFVGLTAFLTIGILYQVPDAWAVFNLAVEPLRSGRDIRFDTLREGRTVRNEEVTFTVSTDESKRYQVTQNLISPLTNERGEALKPGTIKIFSPSNVRGVLRPTLPTSLALGQRILYTSNNTGDADSFVLVFAIDAAEMPNSGVYRSQLVYTLEAVEGGISPVTIVRDIRLEVISEFKMMVQNQRGGQTLDLGQITKDNPVGEGVLTFEISSSIGAPFRIYQEMSGPLSSSAGDTIDSHRILYKTEEIGSGATADSGTLAASRQLVYTSGSTGSSDTFNVIYGAPDLTQQRAGVYRSSLNLSVESTSGIASSKTVNIPVVVDVSNIFNLDIRFEEGSSLNFGAFSEDRTTATRQVFVKVFNNLGSKYQVSQIVARPLSNARGDKIAPKNLMFSVRGPRENTFIAGSKAQVNQGDTVIYVSDSKGSPADLTVRFELTVPVDQQVGPYSTDMSYSASIIQ